MIILMPVIVSTISVLEIVRFKIADDKYETLVTNLDENEFGLSDFKDLYHLRMEMKKLHSIISNMQLVCFYFHCKKRTAYTAGNICINFIL